jgi:sugar/nucleoside kinase (ribokinase family)
MRRTARGADILIGTGGLGTGIFFALQGEETLGREESRGGYLLDSRDFGKLHIVSHYVSVLLSDDFRVLPVGRVGPDPAGQGVLADLRAAGIDTAQVATDPARPTLFSVCFTYPGGEGGNLTALNSASAEVSGADIRAVAPVFQRYAGRGIALAVPEVPMTTRAALLRQAGEHGFLRVGSFVTAELRTETADRLLADLDVLAINADEAAALAGCDPETSAVAVTEAVTALAAARYPQLSLVVTADPGIETRARNSAGAGDAHLGAVIAGLAAGAGLAEANSFATVVSALKVESADTIRADLDVAAVLAAATAAGRVIPVPLRERLRRTPPAGPRAEAG